MPTVKSYTAPSVGVASPNIVIPVGKPYTITTIVDSGTPVYGLFVSNDAIPSATDLIETYRMDGVKFGAKNNVPFSASFVGSFLYMVVLVYSSTGAVTATVTY